MCIPSSSITYSENFIFLVFVFIYISQGHNVVNHCHYAAGISMNIKLLWYSQTIGQLVDVGLVLIYHRNVSQILQIVKKNIYLNKIKPIMM